MMADPRSNEDIIAGVVGYLRSGGVKSYTIADQVLAALSAAGRHIVEVGEWVIPVDGGEPEPLDQALIRRGLYVTEDGEAVIDGRRGRLQEELRNQPGLLRSYRFIPSEPVSPRTDRP